jgi:hypothetical protein
MNVWKVSAVQNRSVNRFVIPQSGIPFLAKDVKGDEGIHYKMAV